jgi:hypothetical protein
MSNRLMIVSLVFWIGCGGSGDKSSGTAGTAAGGAGSGAAGEGGASGTSGSTGGDASAGAAGDGASGTAGDTGGGAVGSTDGSDGGVPPCPATDDHAPKIDPVVFCKNLFHSCASLRGFVIPEAYNTEAKCEVAWAANQTAVSCRSYHLCSATPSNATVQCAYAFGMGGQCAN